MHDSLQRLYRTKLALLATLLLFVGLGLLIFAHWAQHAAGWHWLTNWPIQDIGSGLFTTGLLGVALQYFDGRDSEVRATERLERVLAAAATPAMRDAVIDSFAFEPDDLARVATPETLDKIVTTGLAVRLGDASFAEEIYDDLRQQAIGIPERLHDARVSIRLSMDRSMPTGVLRCSSPPYGGSRPWCRATRLGGSAACRTSRSSGILLTTRWPTQLGTSSRGLDWMLGRRRRSSLLSSLSMARLVRSAGLPSRAARPTVSISARMWSKPASRSRSRTPTARLYLLRQPVAVAGGSADERLVGRSGLQRLWDRLRERA
jgi:hypothetical protein